MFSKSKSKSKSKSSLLLNPDPDPDFDFDSDGSNPHLLRSYEITDQVIDNFIKTENLPQRTQRAQR